MMAIDWLMWLVAALLQCILVIGKDPPVRVVILAGQSNMFGYASSSHLQQLIQEGNEEYTKFRGENGFEERSDVKITFNSLRGEVSNLEIGYGITNHSRFGPEVGFGWTCGEFFEEPILLVKVALGSTSLAGWWRPPSATSNLTTFNETLTQPSMVGTLYRTMVDMTHEVTYRTRKVFPEYGTDDFDIMGFVWLQGFSDAIVDDLRSQYEENLLDLINDVKSEFGREVPFLIGELGIGGDLNSTNEGLNYQYREQVLEIRSIQKRVASMFDDDVIFVDTSQYVIDNGERYDAIHHYWGRADTLIQIGNAFAREIIEQAKTLSPSESPSMVPTDIPSLSFVPSAPSFSFVPTISVKPSSFPSASNEPSMSEPPTKVPSTEPSSTPSTSNQPSTMPSESWTPSASSIPTLSHEPSYYFLPLLSRMPTNVHSKVPSMPPSDSQLPSLSFRPTISTTPTFTPRPSISQIPSTSKVPTESPEPSGVPSTNPSFSQMPLFSPSAEPSIPPSLSSRPSDSKIPTPSPSLSNVPSLSIGPSLLPTYTLEPSWTPTSSLMPSPASKRTVIASQTSPAFASETPTVTKSAFPSQVPPQISSIIPSIMKSSSPKQTSTLSVEPSEQASDFPSGQFSEFLSDNPSSDSSELQSNVPSIDLGWMLCWYHPSLCDGPSLSPVEKLEAPSHAISNELDFEFLRCILTPSLCSGGTTRTAPTFSPAATRDIAYLLCAQDPKCTLPPRTSPVTDSEPSPGSIATRTTHDEAPAQVR